jgi:hypothetical protein
MISKGFKDKVKELLYLYYNIQCDRIINSSDDCYYINARDTLGQPLYLTLELYGNEFDHSNPSLFNVYIDAYDIINRKLFRIDKIQTAINKALDFLKVVKSTRMPSFKLDSNTVNYVLLSGGCSMGRSYLNITYTIPYSKENGFILFETTNSNKIEIAEIGIQNFDCQFKIFDRAKSIVSNCYLTDFSFNLKNDEQSALDDYILKIIVSYDLSIHLNSDNFSDLDITNFFKSLKYDLITYDNIEYVKDFYTVIKMIEI